MTSGRIPTQIYHHPAFAGHDTTPHPENPSRVIAIQAELQRRRLLDDRPAPVWETATDEQILRVHDASLLSSLEQMVASGGGAIDPDTIVFPDSLHVSRLAAGAGVHAVDAIASEEASTAVVLGRPPGHHATRDRSMGFCLLNTIAITAAHALATGFERIALIDWDVHHGNGTQDIFYDRSDVLFCSSHQYGRGFFPGTGSASERGRAAGMGYTLNIPLTMGDGDSAVRAAMEQRILPVVRSYQPNLILVSAGFDAHFADPLGGLLVTDDGFRSLSVHVRDLARELTGGRLIAVLEGGYHPVASAHCVADMIEILDTPSL